MRANRPLDTRARRSAWTRPPSTAGAAASCMSPRLPSLCQSALTMPPRQHGQRLASSPMARCRTMRPKSK
eukprot:1442856-Alexandrium_andersonii.AAC.1